MDGWFVDCIGLNSPLRQYFSLYQAVSQRVGEKKGEMIDDRRNAQQPPNVPTALAVGPIQISRTPWHWKFTQHHRSTQPPT